MSFRNPQTRPYGGLRHILIANVQPQISPLTHPYTDFATVYLQTAQPGPYLTTRGLEPGLQTSRILPIPPACLGLCFLRLEAGLGGAEVSQPAPAQAEAPSRPGRLGLPLKLPRSAPTTKVARQVPGLGQRSRSGSVPLPGAEFQGAGTLYIQNIS